MSRILLFFLALMAATSAFAFKAGEPVKPAGTVIPFDDELRLQFTIEDKQIVAYFIDADKNAVEPPAESIVFEIDMPNKPKDKWRTVLSPGSDARLTSSRLLYPPYDIIARLIVRLKDGSTMSIARADLVLDKNAKSAD